MPIELDDSTKVAVELYVRSLEDEREERRQKRILATVSVATLMVTFVLAILGYITSRALDGTLNNITLSSENTAKKIAGDTVESRLKSESILDTIRKHLDEADDASIKASIKSELANTNATSAESALAKLNTDLAQATNVVKISNDVNGLTTGLAKDPGFQQAVAGYIKPLVSGDVNTLRVAVTSVTSDVSKLKDASWNYVQSGIGDLGELPYDDTERSYRIPDSVPDAAREVLLFVRIAINAAGSPPLHGPGI